jgi:hypothetical protein
LIQLDPLEILVAVIRVFISMYCVHFAVLCPFVYNVKAGEELGPKEESPVEAAVTAGQVQGGWASSSAHPASCKLKGQLANRIRIGDSFFKKAHFGFRI